MLPFVCMGARHAISLTLFGHFLRAWLFTSYTKMRAHFAFSTDFALFAGYASSWYFFAKAFVYIFGIAVSSFVHVAVSSIALFRPTVYRSSWCSAHLWSSCWCSSSWRTCGLRRVKPRPHQSTTFFHRTITSYFITLQLLSISTYP